VEKKKAISSFDHHKGKWDSEPGLYGTRSSHEIYGVVPTMDARCFISSSYDHLYHWDTRKKECIKIVDHYSKSDR